MDLTDLLFVPSPIVPPAGKEQRLLFQAAQLTDYLNAALRTDFRPHSAIDRATSIGRAIDDMWQALARGELRTGEIQMLRTGFMLQNLRDVRARAPDLFSTLAGALVQCRNDDNFFGRRAEAYVASSLLRKGIQITSYESPDFLCTEAQDEFAVECTSIHPLAVSSSKDLQKKISRCLRRKSSKHYALQSSMLAVDVTRALFLSSQHAESEIWFMELHEYLKARKSLKYGAVSIFAYVVKPTQLGVTIPTDSIGSWYEPMRLGIFAEHMPPVIADNATDVLRRFADSTYPGVARTPNPGTGKQARTIREG